VADKTEFQAQSGIAASVKTEGKRFFGSPAIDYNSYIRSYSVFKKLPELYRAIHRLEKEIKELKEDR
jgi:UDP-3-O-[3-hydroxymyristoyl] glucosamine N-acyltransferase